MVLGPGARDRGAECDRIDPSTPGVGFMWCDGQAEPTRFRAAYVTDDDILAMAQQYRPGRRMRVVDAAGGRSTWRRPGDPASTRPVGGGHSAFMRSTRSSCRGRADSSIRLVLRRWSPDRCGRASSWPSMPWYWVPYFCGSRWCISHRSLAAAASHLGPVVAQVGGGLGEFVGDASSRRGCRRAGRPSRRGSSPRRWRRAPSSISDHAASPLSVARPDDGPVDLAVAVASGQPCRAWRVPCSASWPPAHRGRAHTFVRVGVVRSGAPPCPGRQSLDGWSRRVKAEERSVP